MCGTGNNAIDGVLVALRSLPKGSGRIEGSPAKVCGKMTFCVAYVRKIKICQVKSYFESPKIVFFTHPIRISFLCET
jgi:hypothetical protein